MFASLSAPLRKISAPATGMSAMCLAMLLLPVGDTLTKSLTTIIAPAEVAALRASVLTLALAVAYLALRSMAWGKVISIWSMISGLLVAVVSYTLITAFQAMPIATAIAIFFVEPLVLTLLAGLFLKEKPGPRRYAAVGVGMVGILLILRPNFAEFGMVVLYPLAAAFAYAVNMLVTKRATREASGLAFQFGASIFGAVALLAAMVLQLGWDGVSVVSTQIPPWAIAAVIASGILSAVTFLLIALAFTLAQASLLAPFQYLEILGATILGYLVFGDMPDLLTIIGTLIVLGSGLYVFHREGKARVPSRKIRARSDR